MFGVVPKLDNDLSWICCLPDLQPEGDRRCRKRKQHALSQGEVALEILNDPDRITPRICGYSFGMLEKKN